MSDIIRQLMDILSTIVDQEEFNSYFESLRIFLTNQREVKNPRQPESQLIDLAIQVTKCLVAILENFLPTPSIIPNIFTALSKIISTLLRKDTFNAIVEYNLYIDFKSAIETLKKSMEYLVGVHHTVLDINETRGRQIIVVNIENNFNIHTAFSEITHLATEIEAISSSIYLTDSMMEKVVRYCFVSLVREIDFLLLIRIYRLCEINSAGFLNVLEGHRQKDKDLLSFLYKPKMSTLKLFLMYRFDMKWPQVNSFLEVRGLVVEKFSNTYLNDRIFQIVSADDQSIRLSLHDCVLFFCVRAHWNSTGRQTYFKIEYREFGDVNIRCVEHDRHLISRHAWTRADLDKQRGNSVNVDWLLVKVETKSGSDCFVIVAISTENRCIYYDCTGRVHDKIYNPSDSRCFWTLKHIDSSLASRT